MGKEILHRPILVPIRLSQRKCAYIFGPGQIASTCIADFNDFG
jgi:hypothetical protein